MSIDPGNQSESKVQADGSDGVVVAWTSDPAPEPVTEAASKARPVRGQGVYFRKMRLDGKPHGSEHLIHPHGRGRDRLIGLEVQRSGRIKIRWESLDEGGGRQGEFEQDFDGEGNPKSGPRKRAGA